MYTRCRTRHYSGRHAGGGAGDWCRAPLRMYYILLVDVSATIGH